MNAALIKRLYDKDPCHREVISAAGGLKRFVKDHSENLEWDPSGPMVKSRRPVRGDENSKQRTARIAAAFAGALPDYVQQRRVTKEQLREAWWAFCTASGELTGGFSQALYLLVRWRVLARAGGDRFRLIARTDANFKKRHPKDRDGALEGAKPKTLETKFASPVPPHNLPGEFLQLCQQDVYTMQESTYTLLVERKGLSPKAISADNYTDYQHNVLFAEELQMKYDMSLYDLELEDELRFSRGLYKIEVPGLAEKRPSVLYGDTVLLTCKQGKFLGYVHAVSLEHIDVDFHPEFANEPPFSVHFDFNRTPLRSMHRAIDEVDPSLLVANETIVRQSSSRRHPRLNEEQQAFLSAAVQSHNGGYRGNEYLPHLLWGPPGTGKTTTVVHTIVAILQKQAFAKILVTAPSNPAADLLCERLAGLGVKQSEMLRLVAANRDPRLLPNAVKGFTKADAKCFIVPPLQELQGKRVVVSTCTSASYIRSSFEKRSTKGWFTHVIVDEAAQAMEAEVLVPLTLCVTGGRLFLAGDFKQLGPVIRSPVALKFGLGVSLMERIVQCIGIDHSRVFALLKTYRAHPSILSLYNKTVYAGVLQCCSPPSSYDMEGWQECPRGPRGKAHPIIFHHCKGQESRSKESPSWQNEDEVGIVKQYLCKLVAYGVEPEDIGIISPYHKQCQRLRYACLGENLDVEVGTTELFQGREKRVIIISTVRSREQGEVKNDIRFTLGFLGNYKRTNVAISRARSLLIVVGNLSLLSSDATWHHVIKSSKDMRCLRGQPFQLKEAMYGENSEWGQQPSGPSQAGGDGAVDVPWRDYT